MTDLFDGIYGNQEIISFFLSAKKSSCLAHAYIIEGDRGSGKTTLARRIAALLAEGDPALVKKLDEQSCPDVTEFGLPEKKKFIPVETVRTIKTQAYIKPSELDIRVFIIKDAHMLTSAGQNALLKLLEEPPLGVYFFLLAENASSLLPTVRSRAPTVRMQRFSNKQLLDYLEAHQQEFDKGVTEEKESLCLRANGSIGNLLSLINEKSKTKKDGGVDAVIKALAGNDFQALLTAVLSLPQDRRLLEASLSELLAKLRDMIASSCGSSLYIISDPLTIKEARGNMTAKNLIPVCKTVENAIEGLNMNMNVTIIKTSLAKHMMRARK